MEFTTNENMDAVITTVVSFPREGNRKTWMEEVSLSWWFRERQVQDYEYKGSEEGDRILYEVTCTKSILLEMIMFKDGLIRKTL
jgi:hypothetical protein